MPRSKKHLQRSFMSLDDKTSLGLSRMEFWSQIGQYAQFLYEKKELIDVKVTVRGQVFFCHKLVLGCRSKYFATMFQENDTDNITLDEYDPDCFESLIHFMYTGDIEIDFYETSFVQVFKMAQNLEVINLIGFTEDHLEEEIEDNLWLALELADQYSIEFILKRAWDILRKEFVFRCQDEGFLKWDLEHVSNFLLDDFIYISTEVDIFRAVLWWIEYDRRTRLAYAIALMDCVRFAVMTFEELHICGVEGAFLMEEDPRIRDMLPYSFWFQNCVENNKQHLPNFPLYDDRPRTYIPTESSAVLHSNKDFTKSLVHSIKPKKK